MNWIVPEGALVSPLTYILVALAATLLIGFSKGGFGGGVGVLATPLLLLVLPGNIALSLLLPLLIVCDIATLRHFPRNWGSKSYKLLLPGTLVGLFGGLAFLVWFADAENGERAIRLIIGIVALGFVALKIAGPRLRVFITREVREHQPPGWKTGVIAGLIAGFTTMVAHAAGAIVNMFLLSQKLDPQKFVGTCARFFLTVNASKIPLYVLASFISEKEFMTWQTLKWDLWLVPVCPIGVALGAWLNKRLDAKIFTLIIYILLAITGIKMIFS
jgi:uncharacterized protein